MCQSTIFLVSIHVAAVSLWHMAANLATTINYTRKMFIKSAQVLIDISKVHQVSML
jgi:hypothetical protein